MMINGYNLIFLIAILVGIILLQVFLSKKNSKWLGLILPTITLAYSLLAVLGFANYEGEAGLSTLMSLGLVFIYSNIPTALFLIIYFHYKEKRKKLSDLDKMNIQDLH